MKPTVPFRNFANGPKILFLIAKYMYTMFRKCACEKWKNKFKAVRNKIYCKE
jgi:hypothetical protein